MSRFTGRECRVRSHCSTPQRSHVSWTLSGETLPSPEAFRTLTTENNPPCFHPVPPHFTPCPHLSSAQEARPALVILTWGDKRAGHRLLLGSQMLLGCHKMSPTAWRVDAFPVPRDRSDPGCFVSPNMELLVTRYRFYENLMGEEGEDCKYCRN